MPRSKRQRPAWLKCLIALILIVILYFLSFGPVMWLESRGHLKNHRRINQLLALFYAPLVWSHHNTPLHGLIEAYVHLWQPTPSKNK